MNYGFLIDNRKCIGCHACSTACKSENEVPLGVNRTWVKYTEKGVFPETRRFFQVTRCNHCAEPPCVEICPVSAMYQRADGIVEFDSSACIGCKACLQACPYDAIYIDPESHTAAKCHFCAHRVDVGLEPACVVVCPEHAILAGDLDDPSSEIARVLAQEPVRVRKPEQGTKPKLFYVEAEETAIVPMLARQDSGMLWAEWPATDGSDWRGPIRIEEGKMAGALLRSAAAPRETYTVPHRIPWHWQVPAYLVTKGASAGAFLLYMLGTVLGVLQPFSIFGAGVLVAALALAAATGGLLVWDLDRPDRFLRILTRPQFRSWLARGAFILMGYSALLSVAFLGYLIESEALVSSAPVLAAGGALAVLTAMYTGYLFAQAEGRDLWQSPLLPWHMLVQSLLAGSAVLLILVFVLDAHEMVALLRWVLGASALTSLLMTVAGEFGVRHASATASAAARMIVSGRHARRYRLSLAVGLILPLAAALLSGTPLILASAGVLALAGLYMYEWVFVMAPQEVPNS